VGDLADIFGIFDPDSHDVFAGFERVGNVDFEREIAIAVSAALNAVDVDRRVIVDCTEPEEDPLPVGNLIEIERSPVPSDTSVIGEFVGFLPRRGYRNRKAVTVVGPSGSVVPLDVDAGIFSVTSELPASV
jgi:hypothetical protein